MLTAASRPPELSDSLSKISWAVWAVLLVTIPITSSPLIALFIPETPVSPLSGVPLVLLFFLWIVPFLLRARELPKIMIPLAVFIVVALVATFRAPFLELYPFKGNSVFDHSIRALITLGIGVGFYFVTATLPNSPAKIRSSLRWIYVGAGLMFIWSTVQIIRLPYSFNPAPIELARIQKYISITDLFRYRISGMAYEPSWLADQLAILYLPMFMGSIVAGYSVFPMIWKRVSVEHILLLWGSIILFFTYSRIGLVAFFATIGVLMIRISSMIIEDRIQSVHARSRWSMRQLRPMYWGSVIFLFLVAVAIITVLAFVTYEPFADLLKVNWGERLQSERHPLVFNLVNSFRYAERVMYWISAFLVFCQFPFLGVGLGNLGFLFRDVVPAFGYYLPEILAVLGPDHAFVPNAKSLWLRILAETGLIGFTVFAVWLILLGFGTRRLILRESKLLKVLGIAGGLSLIAQIFEGFSLDTFALPQLWIVMGFVTAALSFPRRTAGGETR